MKMRLLFAIVLFAAISCNNKEEKKEIMNMPGAYNMLSQTLNDGTKDSIYNNAQLKIYTDDYMMYAHINLPDSVSGFGLTTYSVSDTGTVIEHALYHASSDAADSTPATFVLQIEKTPKGYKQIIPEMEYDGRKVKLTEEYEAVGGSVKTALDGVWKEVKSYTIKGTDTTTDKLTQYKTYYAGHFMFGHTYVDSANKLHTGIGYGTFEMNGTNKIKETVIASTYSSIRGKSFDIDIEINGTDEFKQTITEADGGKWVEVYRRLKK